MTEVLMLVVSRDPALTTAVMACAQGTGCLIRLRDTLDEALVDLQTNPEIGLILLDTGLVEGTLADDVALVRATPGCAEVPLVLLFPADTPESELNAGLDAGADASLVCPLQCATLRAWVLMAGRLKAIAYTITGVAREAMGRVSEPLLRSAALAHAISTPLQNIASAIDLVELSLPASSEELAQVATIRHNVQRAGEIVRTASEEARQALRRVNGHG